MSDSKDFWGQVGAQALSAGGDFLTRLFFGQRMEEREDSAVQRRMADLKKAGINPLLAVSGGSAGGASSQAIMPPEKTNIDYSAARMLGQQMRNMNAEYNNMKSVNDKLQSEIIQARALSQTASVEAEKSRRELEFYTRNGIVPNVTPPAVSGAIATKEILQNKAEEGKWVQVNKDYVPPEGKRNFFQRVYDSIRGIKIYRKEKKK